MENCKAFKQHLEDLVEAKHLKEYIDEEWTRWEANKVAHKRTEQRDKPPRKKMDLRGSSI